MNNQPILSLCIPTNGAVQWILPVLNSIYNQNYDLSKFEVVITDNGKDSQLPLFLNNYSYPNLRYIQTTDEGFLNLVTSIKKGKGIFCKMVNHRSLLLPGSIEDMVKIVEMYEKNQPVIYCADGRVKGDIIIECDNLDIFLKRLSYWASWSAGIGFWKKDIPNIDTIELDKMFPNASLLFDLRKDSKYVIWNKKYQMMGDDTGKGGYNVFQAFGVVFLDIISNLRIRGRIKQETFVYLKQDIYKFVRNIYHNEVVMPTKHKFITKNVHKCLMVYYGNYYYWKMFVLSWMRAPLSYSILIIKMVSKRIFGFTKDRHLRNGAAGLLLLHRK